MFKKSLSLILLTVLVLTSFVIPAYADSVIGEIGTEEMGPIENDRLPLKDAYTEDELKSILAGDHNFDIPDEGLVFNAENFPLAVDENVVSPDILDIPEDDYYIAVIETGKVLFAPNSTYITTTPYGQGEASMWVFEEVSPFIYVIRNKLNPELCLAAVPSTSGNSAITKKICSLTDPTCHWSVHVYQEGNVLRSEATETNADGQYLYLSGNRFVLSSTNHTKVGLIDVDWFVPCTSLSLENYYILSPGKQQYLEVAGSTPANANVINNGWVTYSIASSSIATINQDSYVEGKGIGTTTVTVTHKLTGATGSAPVYVGYPTKINIYYDNAFLDQATNSNGKTASYMINYFMEDVRVEYAKTLNINLIINSITLEKSYPEQEVNGIPVCDQANNRFALCECSDDCENSGNNGLFGSFVLEEYHHKNLYNMFYRITEPNINNNIKLVFTGHAVCYERNGNCQTGIYGLASENYGYAIVTTMFSGTDFLKKTIAHEIGHMFAPNLDHYDDELMNIPPSDLNKDQDPNCIWGENKNDEGVYDILEMCTGCMNAIRSNANKYNHN